MLRPPWSPPSPLRYRRKPCQTPSPAQFQHAQEALEHQIIARQVQLVLLGTEVANAANVTTSDRSALVTIITNEQSALATDATNAAAATTDAELATVRSAVIGDERVYAVVTGQVNLVVAADNETVTEGGYTALITELTPFVTELGSAHATALLSDVTSQVTAATALTSPVSADALALTPAGYPGNASQIKTWTFQTGQAGPRPGGSQERHQGDRRRRLGPAQAPHRPQDLTIYDRLVPDALTTITMPLTGPGGGRFGVAACVGSYCGVVSRRQTWPSSRRLSVHQVVARRARNREIRKAWGPPRRRALTPAVA